MTIAALIAGGAFFALVALSIVFDGLAKLKRVRADAELLSGPRYRRVDLELAVDAAIHRASVLRSRAPERELAVETRELVAVQVLEDLDLGHLGGPDAEAIR